MKFLPGIRYNNCNPELYWRAWFLRNHQLPWRMRECYTHGRVRHFPERPVDARGQAAYGGVWTVSARRLLI